MNSGERIRQVRELKGLTQTELASLVDKDQSFIAQIEGGLKETPEQLIKLIAFKTGFPPSFFRQMPPPEFPSGSLAFRSHASLTRRDKLSAYRYAQLAFEFVEKISNTVSRVPVNLPKRLDTEPIEGAKIIRSEFGLSPDRPIGHLLNVLEKMGVLIILLPLNLPTLDAFSLWAGEKRDKPIIAAMTPRPGDRLRFSLSHELWHLVSVPQGTQNEIERDADIFASAFLMPGAAIRPELTPNFTLTTAAQLKSRWGVSMQTIIRKAYDLKVISERQYRYWMQQMSIRGWRTKEPVLIEAEKPSAILRIVDKTRGRTFADSSLPSAFVKQMLAAQAA